MPDDLAAPTSCSSSLVLRQQEDFQDVIDFAEGRTDDLFV